MGERRPNFAVQKQGCRLEDVVSLLHRYLCSAVWHNEALLGAILGPARLHSAMVEYFMWCCTECLGKAGKQILAVLRASRRGVASRVAMIKKTACNTIQDV